MHLDYSLSGKVYYKGVSFPSHSHVSANREITVIGSES